MSQLNDIPLSALHFYLTSPYECSYLPDEMARSQVATPAIWINKTVYSKLVQKGFRRSGTHTYRPRCDTCQACVPFRIVAASFHPNRSQRRAWSQHVNLQASLHGLVDKPEYYALYLRYQRSRHPNGGMDDDDYESYQNFLLNSHVDSLLVEFREDGVLRMLSVIDVLTDGLSAVYTFYDPDVPRARFGVYNVLWQVALCQQLGLDFVYLGYWIANSRKMAYKIQYQPAQGWVAGEWVGVEGEG